MNVTQQEAQASLRDIENTMAQTRRALAHGGGPYYLILWGAIWLVGFLITQFAPPSWSGWTWVILDTLGGVLSFWIGYRLSLRVRNSVLGPRIGLFWLVLIVYAALWFWLSPPSDSRLLALMISLYAMFGYVVMGLWLHTNIPLYIGLGVTVLALLAYFFLPQVFYLVMGLLAGGTMIFSGWAMLRRWRV